MYSRSTASFIVLAQSNNVVATKKNVGTSCSWLELCIVDAMLGSPTAGALETDLEKRNLTETGTEPVSSGQERWVVPPAPFVFATLKTALFSVSAVVDKASLRL